MKFSTRDEIEKLKKSTDRLIELDKNTYEIMWDDSLGCYVDMCGGKVYPTPRGSPRYLNSMKYSEFAHLLEADKVGANAFCRDPDSEDTYSFFKIQ